MLTIADAAPDFSLPGVHQGKTKNYSLRDTRGQWLVLFFQNLGQRRMALT